MLDLTYFYSSERSTIIFRQNTRTTRCIYYFRGRGFSYKKI